MYKILKKTLDITKFFVCDLDLKVTDIGLNEICTIWKKTY